MKKILFLILVLSSTSISFAQTAADYVAKAEKEIQNMNEKQALLYYKKATELDGKNVDALCGTSFMMSRIGNREKNENLKKSFFRSAKAIGEKALALNPKSAEANFVMAVAMGRMALISGSKEKVAASRDIKKYAERAVKLDPKHAMAWSVLGRYNMGVANLNFAEKGAANLLFGGLPEGDLKTAISCFEKSRSLDPSYIANYSELGEAYKQSGNKTLAKSILQKGLSLPNQIEDDASLKVVMKSLLSKL